MNPVDQHRILVIENQLYQFREMQSHFLRAGKYAVFPFAPEVNHDKSDRLCAYEATNTFVPLMDSVRIFLNPAYGGKKQQDAADRIRSIVQTFDPHLFVVDQILVGNYKALNGTYLAKTLLSSYKKPILFLSRSDQFREDVRNDLADLRNQGISHEWISKGFSGLYILEREYFDTQVITTVDRLLQLAPDELLLTHIDGLLELHEIFDILEAEEKRRLVSILERLRTQRPPGGRLEECVMNYRGSLATAKETRAFADELFSIPFPTSG